MIEHRDNCRICNSKEIIEFLDLGTVPLAGGFIKEEEIKDEKKYPLKVYFCKNCSLVQVIDIVPAEELFLDYRYLSSSTNMLSNHFKELAQELKERFGLEKNSFVVEIGPNDGVLLKPVSELGIKALGFEPASNVAKIAREKGLDIINDFFTSDLAEKVSEEKGRADIITANNVFAHIDDIHEIMKGINILLKEDGTFIFEVHYIVDLIEKIQYDTIYHEHLCYYSIKSLQNLMEQYEMEIVDIKRIPIHSGSIRVYAKKTGKTVPSSIVAELIQKEKDMMLHEGKGYLDFSKKVDEKKDELVDKITEIKKKGKKIIGYGAAGRATILLNFCRIGKDMLDYVIDVSPERAGRVMPGVHIPIVKPSMIKDIDPDYILILAWSYTEEIMEKEDWFVKKGGRFIIPLPDISIEPKDVP